MVAPPVGQLPGNDPQSSLPPWRSFCASFVENACHRPLLPICAGFIAGCLTSSLVSAPLLIALAALTLLGALALLTASPRLRGFSGIAAGLGLLLMGVGFGSWRCASVLARNASNSLAVLLQPGSERTSLPVRVQGVVASPLHRTPRGAWLLMGVEQVSSSVRNIEIDHSGDQPRIFVSLPASVLQSSQTVPQVGDRLSVAGEIATVQAGSDAGSNDGWSGWLREQGACATLTVPPAAGSLVVGVQSATLTMILPRLADRFREWCDQRLGASLAPQTAVLAGGILLGERGDLTPAQTSAFSAAGCAHLLATAGLHVGILVLVLEFLSRAFTVPRKMAAVAIIGCVWLYALAAEDRAAVARAASVATLYYGAILLERAPDVLSALALCSVGMLWANPLTIHDAGFQLSFCTVLGLIVVMPVLTHEAEAWTARIANRSLRRAAERVIEVECLALAAQAVAAPLVAAQFNQISVLGVFANLLACPLMFALIPVALLSLAVSAVSLAAGALCLRLLLGPLVAAIYGIIGGFAALPGCAVSAAALPSWAIALYYALLLAVCVLLRGRQSKSHEADSSNTAADRRAASLPGAAAANTAPGALAGGGESA